MNLKSSCVISTLVAILITLAAGPVDCDSTMYLSVCQELVNTARSYEARANSHSNIAKAYQMQIQNLATMPKNQGTISAMDSLFSQYDQNRTMENKFRLMFRQATDEADKCMRSAQ